MKDALAINESEESARAKLVELCSAMLSGKLSYFEGAVMVCQRRHQIRVAESYPDITAFVAISSETDHLPLQAVRHRWSEETLRGLEPEFQKTEVWAQPFASKACESLLSRFAGAQQAVQADLP